MLGNRIASAVFRRNSLRGRDLLRAAQKHAGAWVAVIEFPALDIGAYLHADDLMASPAIYVVPAAPISIVSSASSARSCMARWSRHRKAPAP